LAEIEWKFNKTVWTQSANVVFIAPLFQKTNQHVMFMKVLGKLLFPHLPAWQQRRRANTVVLVLVTAILFAAIVGAVMYWSNAKR
jgi:hypothetical protein